MLIFFPPLLSVFLSICWGGRSSRKKHFSEKKKFDFFSTLIISISVDMFVCWVVDLVEKKNFEIFFYPYYQYFCRYVGQSIQSKKQIFEIFFYPYYQQFRRYVCLSVCLLGGRQTTVILRFSVCLYVCNGQLWRPEESTDFDET